MDKTVFIPSAVLGAMLVIGYLVIAFKRKTTPELKNMVSLFLAAAGFVGGIVLILGCFSEDARKHVADLPTYIFIAGMSMLYISAQTAFRDLNDWK